MRKPSMLALVLLAALGLMLLWAGGDFWVAGVGEEPEVDAESKNEPSSTGALGGNDRASDPGTPARRGIEGADASAPVVRETTVTGRVVMAETGTPIGGAVVTLKANSPHTPTSWLDPGPCVTSANGRYEIRLRPFARGTFDFRVAATGRVPATGGSWRLAPGVLMDHGDVTLLPAVPTTIRVVAVVDASEAGETRSEAPVDGFAMQVKRAVRSDYTQRFGIRPLNGLCSHSTDDEGRLPELTLHSGQWRLETEQEPGWDVLGPVEIEIADHETSREVVFRVTRPDPKTAISGRVEDTLGVPVVGLELGAKLTTAKRTHTTRTDANGLFVFGRLQQAKDPFRIGPVPRERRYRLPADQSFVEARLGTSDLKIVVERLIDGRLPLHVVEAETGAPITLFSWSTQEARDQQRYDGTTYTRLEGSPRLNGAAHHEGGRTTLELAPGDYVLNLRTKDVGRADVLGRMVRVAPGQNPELRIAVPRLIHWQVRVRDTEGRPVAGSTVRLLHHVGKGGVSDQALPIEVALRHGIGGSAVDFVIDAGETNTNGMVALSSSPRLSTAALHVRGATHKATLLPDLTVSQSGQIIDVTVEGAAVLLGEVRPRNVVSAWGPTASARQDARLFWDAQTRLRSTRPAVFVRPIGSRSSTLSAPVADDGTFRIESVPPGDVELRVVARMRQPRGPAAQVGQVARVDNLRPGEERKVVIDVQHLTPIAVEGHAHLDGRPAADRALHFVTARGQFTTRTMRDGAFRVDLLPGTCYVTLTGDEACNGVDIHAEDPLEVGQSPMRRDVVFRVRTLRVRCVTKSGKPIANRRILAMAQVHRLRFSSLAKTDAEGRIEFSPVPNRSIELYAMGIEPIAGVAPVARAGSSSALLRLGAIEPPHDGSVMVNLVFGGEPAQRRTRDRRR